MFWPVKRSVINSVASEIHASKVSKDSHAIELEHRIYTWTCLRAHNTILAIVHSRVSTSRRKWCRESKRADGGLTEANVREIEISCARCLSICKYLMDIDKFSD